MLFRLRNSLLPTGDSPVPKRVRTTWLASRHSHAFLIHYRNCLLRVVAVGQSDSSESSHPPAVGKLPTPSMPTNSNSGKCRFSRQMKVISVVSDIWSQSFYWTEASFQFNSQIYRSHGTMSPRKFLSKPEVDFLIWKVPVPWYRKVAPRIGIPVPSQTKHAAGHCCWMKIGVCVFCHMELRFWLHHTSSCKFYSTLMKDFIDDCNAMIARRPCHGSWILRVWTVNESWRFRSVSSPVSKPNVVSGVSGRKYRYQLFKATVWHHTL